MRFEVKKGEGLPQDGTINRRGARCIVCNEVAPLDHVRTEGKAGRMRRQLMAIAAEGNRKRIYLSPIDEHVSIANKAVTTLVPDADLPRNPRDFKTPNYGMLTFGALFTKRQLVALTTFSDLVSEAKERAEADAVATGCADATDYAAAIATYLAFATDKGATFWCSLCYWQKTAGKIGNALARHAIPMVWDYSECNPFSQSSGNWTGSFEWIARFLEKSRPTGIAGDTQQRDATNYNTDLVRAMISTDPPYYDNIGYADLSDFFTSGFAEV